MGALTWRPESGLSRCGVGLDCRAVQSSQKYAPEPDEDALPSSVNPSLGLYVEKLSTSGGQELTLRLPERFLASSIQLGLTACAPPRIAFCRE